MTDWPLIAVRFALYADLALLFGLPLFGLLLPDTGARRAFAGPLLRWTIAVLAMGGIGLSCLGLALNAAAMAGLPLSGVDRSMLSMLVGGTALGTAWKARIAACALALAGQILRRSPATLYALNALGGAVALATLAWSGHGAATEGALGWLHLGSDIVHLIAAGAWIGAIAALLLLARRGRTERDHLRLTYIASDRFSATGTLLVGTILFTGIINGYVLVGPANLLALPAGPYGRLLLLKLLLFVGMLCLAAANRFRLTPALGRQLAGDATSRLATLRRSLTTEFLAAVAILALVAWLGTLAPPASAG